MGSIIINSNGTSSSATPTSAAPAPIPGVAPPALVVVALLLVVRASLAQRRHMLLEMRVSWMLIFLG